MLPLRHARRWKLAGFSVLALVFASALVPAFWFMHDLGDPGFIGTDKLLHLAAFAFLTVWFTGQYRRQSYWRVALALLAFGVLIELCQMLLSWRTAEVGDLLADAAGIAVGLVIALSGAGGWSQRMEEWAHARQ